MVAIQFDAHALEGAAADGVPRLSSAIELRSYLVQPGSREVGVKCAEHGSRAYGSVLPAENFLEPWHDLCVSESCRALQVAKVCPEILASSTLPSSNLLQRNRAPFPDFPPDASAFSGTSADDRMPSSNIQRPLNERGRAIALVNRGSLR